jgi:hypothetical protein
MIWSSVTGSIYSERRKGMRLRSESERSANILELLLRNRSLDGGSFGGRRTYTDLLVTPNQVGVG